MSDETEQTTQQEQHQETSEHIISAAAAPYAVVEDPAPPADGAQPAPQPSTDASAGVDDEGNPLRTLFMSGFPVDVKKREIHNLFRFAHGFESVSLNNRGRGPVAFVTFIDQPSALAARSVINQTRFDPEIAMDLHVELAKNNSFAAGGKKRGADDAIDGGSEKRARHESVDAMYSRPPPPGAPMGKDGPITTLFVANLGMYSTEDELRQLFAMLPGFRRLRFNQTKGAPVAFIDYTEVQYAQQAKQTYEGYKLPSSPSPSGLRIEFAKNNMGGPPDPPMKPMGYPGYAIPAPAQAYNVSYGDPYGSSAFSYPAYPGVGVPFTYDPNAQQHHPYK